MGRSFQHVLAGEHIAVETKDAGNWSKQNRNDLQAPNGEEHYRQNYLLVVPCSLLRSKQLL